MDGENNFEIAAQHHIPYVNWIGCSRIISVSTAKIKKVLGQGCNVPLTPKKTEDRRCDATQ
jgi:hypothetical protein